jgi:hypothetical protein
MRDLVGRCDVGAERRRQRIDQRGVGQDAMNVLGGDDTQNCYSKPR